MTTTHTRPGLLVLTSVVTALTTWATLWSWRGFSDASSSYLAPLLFTCLLIGLVGALLRWLRAPVAVIVLVQLLVTGVVVLWAFGGSPVPTGESIEQLRRTFDDAIAAANRYAAPVPFHEGSLQAPLVTLGMLCAILVDLIACSLRRAPLAGLPLLAIYSVPVSLLDGVSWFVFVFAAAGYLLMLFLQEESDLVRWGWSLESSDSTRQNDFGVRTGRNRTTAFQVGTAATAIGVLLPVVIPTLSLEVFDGNGPGDGRVQLQNPMTDLRRDLLSQEDRPLMQVTTDDRDPRYLRFGVLTRFNGSAWQPGDRDLDDGIDTGSKIPAPYGVAAALPRTPHSYQATVTEDFQSTWLPIQVPLTSVDTTSNWRYDPNTQDLFTSVEDETTAGSQYEFTADRLQYDQDDLLRSTAAVPAQFEEYLDLPSGIPAEVEQLTRVHTDGYRSPYEKAVALQDWFRRDFDYSLEPRPASGTRALTSFLSDQSGYCEQFAGTMALMARQIGIPSRVALGFLSPDRVDKDTYEYSTDDLHAWVELYFPGSGWVLFDPTPASRVAETPGYTQNLPDPIDESDLPTAEASESETGRATTRPERSADENAAGADEQDGQGQKESFPWLPLLVVVGLLLLIGLLGLLPSWVRHQRRERRFRPGQSAELAWQELRDVMVDHRLVWPHGLSPRETSRRIASHFAVPPQDSTALRPEHGPGVNPEADDAMVKIAMAVERGRYAADGDPTTSADLRPEVELCSEAIAGGVTPRVRRSARWWPRSVLGRRRRRRGSSHGPTAGPPSHENRVEELVP